MTTLTQMVAARRQPLLAQWQLVTDERGRTRPQMRWVPTEVSPVQRARGDEVRLAA